MKVRYLGTGASEGLPCLFCACPVCAEALATGGRNVRRRASMLVEDNLLLDLTPDLWSSSLMLKQSLSGLQHLLITHEHREHFYVHELRNFFPPYTQTRATERINVVGNKHVQSMLEAHLSEEQRETISFTLIRPFKPIKLGEYKITALFARHCNDAYLYLIEKDGKTLLYGNDTGFLPEQTWDFLAGHRIHLVSLDCNNPVNKDTPNHMNLEDAITTRRRMYQIGCTTTNTKFFITHISHNSGMNHAQIEEHVLLHGIHAAYDGMEIVL